MANRKVSMLRIRKLIQLTSRGLSQRKISKEVKMGRNIVSMYLGQIEQTGQSYQALLALDDADLGRLLLPSAKEIPKDERYSILEPLLSGYAKELGRTGVTKLLLWEEYRSDYPQGYGYTQFKRYLNHYISNRKPSFHNQHIAGREMQVDFAGDPLYVTDKRTGERKSCPVLVCTLPFSGRTFAIALYDARQEAFYYGLNRAVAYFGGITESVKSDNMRQWVKRANRYEPTFNDATIRWGLHYQTELTATRVAKPKDKAHVECHVNIVYQRVYARSRNEVFHSLEALNARMLELLDEHNSKPMQGHPYSRNDRFLMEEKQLLRPLPRDPFLFKFRKEFTVNSTYHTQISPEQHFYSIPHQYIGYKAVIIYDYQNVEVYIGLERIAFHPRSYVRGGYTTNPDHMPEHHRAYRRSQEYNADYYLRKAAYIGPAAKEAVTRILSSKVFVQQAYGSCAGVISLVRKYPADRIEAACCRAISSPVVTYTMVKRILEKELDTVSKDPNPSTPLPEHDNIRGASAYN